VNIALQEADNQLNYQNVAGIARSLLSVPTTSSLYTTVDCDKITHRPLVAICYQQRAPAFDA